MHPLLSNTANNKQLDNSQLSKPPRMLGLTEASRESGLPVYTLRRLCAQQKITHIKSGVKVYINMDKLYDTLNQTQTTDKKGE